MNEVTGNGSFDEGLRLFSAGRFAEAVPVFRAVLEADPSNSKAHAYLGAACSQLGQHDAAVAEFQKLTNLEPTNANNYFNLGKAYEACGKEADALSAYRKAAALKPGYQKAEEAIAALAAKQTPAAPTQTSAQPFPTPQQPRQPQQPQGATPWAQPTQQSHQQPTSYMAGSPMQRPPAQSPYGGARPVQQPVYTFGDVPAEIKGKVNMGAFLLPFFWSIAHNTWIGLLVVVPFLGWFIMPLVLLFKGNEWGWKNRHFDSVEHFKLVQSIWMKWGIGVVIASIVFGLIIGFILGAAVVSMGVHPPPTGTYQP